MLKIQSGGLQISKLSSKILWFEGNSCHETKCYPISIPDNICFSMGYVEFD